MPDLTNGSVTVTSPLAPATNVSVPAGSTTVLTSPGVVGPPGAGVNLAGSVDTYADLPTGLGTDQAGVSYVVNANGKLYVWSGTSFPTEADGSDFRGETGATGTGVSSVTLVGSDTLRFGMTDTTNTDIVIPAITAAAASATAAAASASAAASSAGSASGSAAAASASATAASGSASSAATQATNAASSATAASGSASSAATQAGNASTSATAAASSATAAAGSATSAGTSASNASSSASNASSSASNASSSASNASSSASAAATSESNAASAATDAANSAADAAATVAAGMTAATATAIGGIKLPGGTDGVLGGTSDTPTVTGWANKADLVGGVVPSSQLPAVTGNAVYVVTATSDRTALTGVNVGDVCVQTGNPGRGSYILHTLPASTDGNWVLMNAPTDAVTSVNGYNGAVVLAKADLSLGNVDNTSDVNKPVSTAQQTALNAKANSSTTVSAGTGLTGGGDLSANRTLAVSYGTATGTAAQGNDTRIVNAVQSSRQVIAGTGLSGGGDLSADRTLAVAYGTTASTATQGNDTRVVNAVQGSRQVVAGTGLTGGGDLTADRTFAVAYGTSSTSACVGNDSRLSDKRTPIDGWVPWCPEMVCNGSALTTGYNDMIGGVLVEPGPNTTGVILDAIAVRLGDPTATIGGSGNLTVTIYAGSPTAAQTTLIATITLAAGGHDSVTTLGTPFSCSANTVLRAYFTLGSTTVAGPVHIQFRGRYA